MGGRPGGCGVLVSVAVVAAGCASVFKGEVTQPNPIAYPTETLRISEPIDVVTGDMDLYVPRYASAGLHAAVIQHERVKLHNVASFMIVSRDRLRFHVQLEHKWQEWADLSNWTATLEDDRGHRWAPEGLDHATTHLLTQMWDQEVRTAERNRFGDITRINDDGWRDVQPLGSISIFRGRGDFVFYQRDLLRPDCRWLRLVIAHPGERFEFRWDFTDEVASAP
jgi:hypothetical protein